MKGILGVAMLSMGLVGGATLGLTPLIPLLFVSRRLYDAFAGVTQTLWGHFIVGVTERVYGVRFVFSGDQLPFGGRVLLFSNHRTRLDWLFLWAISLHSNNGAGWRIILKSALKNVPWLGWALQQFHFLFIQRNLEADGDHMGTVLRSYSEMDKFQLLIFPEGTDLSAKNMARSDAFADKNGLPHYKYVLHPRVKGWWLCLDALGSSVDTVLDCTVAYTPTIPQNESVMVKGATPKEVHIHVTSLSPKDVPSNSEEAASRWMAARFAAKETQLAEFYDKGEFPALGTVRRLKTLVVYASFLYFLGLFAALLYIAASCWMVGLAVMAAYFGIFVGLHVTVGGFDKLALKLHPPKKTVAATK